MNPCLRETGCEVIGRQFSSTIAGERGGEMLEPNQRVAVDLSGLVIKGVSFSQNVQRALGTVVQQVSADPPVYLVELLFSFKGIKRVEVPEDRIRPA
ncbi:MAG TPA: hypothetical protein VFN71_13760 [Methylomirabilota bacterium]|nr:hypothetical protein [Methylomirabilota bacterium]